MESVESEWVNIKDPDEYNRQRELAYKEFFGRSWEDIIDHWMVEDCTPEDAVEILGENGLLDYCDSCKTYYLTREGSSCPYCGRESF